MKFNFDHPINRSHSLKYDTDFLTKLYGHSDLTPMWVADMDFKVMPQITEALTKQAKLNSFGYQPQTHIGLSFINWYAQRHGVNMQKNWVTYANSLVQSLHLVIENFVPPQGQIIIQTPVYMEFQNSIHNTHRTTLLNELIYENNTYSIHFEQLEEIASQKGTHALILCNPHNPVGRVWTREELAEIARICKKHHVLIIADEIHADIVYEPHAFTSMLTFEEIHDNLVVLYSPGKTFNLAALATSFVVIPDVSKMEQFKLCVKKYHLERISPFSEAAMQTAFTYGKEWVTQLLPYLAENIRAAQHLISQKAPLVKMAPVEGTYLLWLDMNAFPLRGMALVRYLAKEAKIGVINGRMFGPSGDGFIRINVALPRAEMLQALTQFCDSLNQIPPLEN